MTQDEAKKQTEEWIKAHPEVPVIKVPDPAEEAREFEEDEKP